MAQMTHQPHKLAFRGLTSVCTVKRRIRKGPEEPPKRRPPDPDGRLGAWTNVSVPAEKICICTTRHNRTCLVRSSLLFRQGTFPSGSAAERCQSKYNDKFLKDLLVSHSCLRHTHTDLLKNLRPTQLHSARIGVAATLRHQRAASSHRSRHHCIDWQKSTPPDPYWRTSPTVPSTCGPKCSHGDRARGMAAQDRDFSGFVRSGAG